MMKVGDRRPRSPTFLIGVIRENLWLTLLGLRAILF